MEHGAPAFLWDLAGRAWNIWHPRFCRVWRGTRGTYGTRVSAGVRGPCAQNVEIALRRALPLASASSAADLAFARRRTDPGAIGAGAFAFRGACCVAARAPAASERRLSVPTAPSVASGRRQALHPLAAFRRASFRGRPSSPSFSLFGTRVLRDLRARALDMLRHCPAASPNARSEWALSPIGAEQLDVRRLQIEA